jgi:hypothetical protein
VTHLDGMLINEYFRKASSLWSLCEAHRQGSESETTVNLNRIERKPFRSSKAPTVSQSSLLILRSLEQLPRPPNVSFFNLTEDPESSENRESISEEDSNNKKVFKNTFENPDNSDNSDNEEIIDSNFLNIEEALRAGKIFEILEKVFQADEILKIKENFKYVRKSSRKSKFIQKVLDNRIRISQFSDYSKSTSIDRNDQQNIMKFF